MFWRSRLALGRRMIRRCGVPALSLGATVAAVILLAPPMARAIPSFARQTGSPCSAGHAAYPQLNAFGREFKLNRYSLDTGDSGLPPVSFLVQPAFTHTGASQAGGAAPHFGDNESFALQQVSGIYGGKIYDRLGAFVQFIHSGVGQRHALSDDGGALLKRPGSS